MIRAETMHSIEQEANDRVADMKAQRDRAINLGQEYYEAMLNVEDRWKEAMRELREMTIAEDIAAVKRRVFDLILFGPKTVKDQPNA